MTMRRTAWALFAAFYCCIFAASHVRGDTTPEGHAGGSLKAGTPWGHPKWCHHPQPWSSSLHPVPYRDLGRMLPPLSSGHSGGGSHQPSSSGCNELEA